MEEDLAPGQDLEQIKAAIMQRAERLCQFLDLRAPLIVINAETRLLNNATSAALNYAILRDQELEG